MYSECVQKDVILSCLVFSCVILKSGLAFLSFLIMFTPHVNHLLSVLPLIVLSCVPLVLK